MYAPHVVAESLPSFQERTFYFQQFVDAGIAVAGIDSGESNGGIESVASCTRLFQAMITRGYSSTPVMFARSRGGLWSYNWAIANPNNVSAIAGIFPAGDLLSYPGSSPDLWADYGFSAEAPFLAALPNINPVAAGRLAGLASAGVPIYHVHGDSDVTVPIEDNSAVIKSNYDALAGTMTLEVIPGLGHVSDPAFFENQALANFVIANAR